MATLRSIPKLENGSPHFRFWHKGGGVYKVFVQLRSAAATGAEVCLGEIRTAAPIARAVDPGKWIVKRAEPLDSMNEAAMVLLTAAKEEQFLKAASLDGLEHVA